jgi:cytoskeleton protein RodZ
MNPGVVEEAEQQLESIDGPGRRLQQARLARNLELSRAAAQLHLSVPMLTALEGDDYSELPEAVFVRGYIANYARLLGLPVEPLVAAYNARLPGGEGTTRELGRVRLEGALDSGHKPARVIGILVMIGVGVLVGLWAKSRLEPPETPVPEIAAPSLDASPSVPPMTGTPDVADAPQAAGGSGQAAGQGPGPEQPKAESLELVTAARAEEVPEPGAEVAEPQAAPGPAQGIETESAGPLASIIESAPVEPESMEGAAAAAAEPEVLLELLGPCWVDIRDANGNNKIIGELEKGVQKVIRGEPPFSVVLGNSRAVRLLVNGEPYDVGRHAQGNVARFKLTP